MFFLGVIVAVLIVYIFFFAKKKEQIHHIKLYRPVKTKERKELDKF